MSILLLLLYTYFEVVLITVSSFLYLIEFATVNPVHTVGRGKLVGTSWFFLVFIKRHCMIYI